VTRDRQIAYTAAFARVVESRHALATPADVRALERAVVVAHFGGSKASYRAALAKAGAGQDVARGVLADELRQAAIESRIRVGSPSASAVASFYKDYGALRARPVAVRPAPWWLGGQTQGIAIASVAPDQVFRLAAGRWTAIRTPFGEYRVQPLGATTPLASVPLSQAQGAIRGALQKAARENAYQSWTVRRQRSALQQTSCRRDSLPSVGAVDLTSYLPFLAI
jgi:hypothetical protein